MNKTILICNNRRANPNQPSCAQRGSLLIGEHLNQWIQDNHLPIQIQYFKCLGQCENGPNIKLLQGEFIQEVNIDELESVKQKLLTFIETK